LARRYRDRRRLAELRAADEAAEQAARATVLETMLREAAGDDAPNFGDGTSSNPPG